MHLVVYEIIKSLIYYDNHVHDCIVRCVHFSSTFQRKQNFFEKNSYFLYIPFFSAEKVVFFKEIVDIHKTEFFRKY